MRSIDSLQHTVPCEQQYKVVCLISTVQTLQLDGALAERERVKVVLRQQGLDEEAIDEKMDTLAEQQIKERAETCTELFGPNGKSRNEMDGVCYHFITFCKHVVTHPVSCAGHGPNGVHVGTMQCCSAVCATVWLLSAHAVFCLLTPSVVRLQDFTAFCQPPCCPKTHCVHVAWHPHAALPKEIVNHAGLSVYLLRYLQMWTEDRLLALIAEGGLMAKLKGTTKSAHTGDIMFDGFNVYKTLVHVWSEEAVAVSIKQYKAVQGGQLLNVTLAHVRLQLGKLPCCSANRWQQQHNTGLGIWLTQCQACHSAKHEGMTGGSGVLATVERRLKCQV